MDRCDTFDDHFCSTNDSKHRCGGLRPNDIYFVDKICVDKHMSIGIKYVIMLPISL